MFKARQTKFKESIIQSNIPLLIDCLGLGVDPNTEFDDGNYALHIATEKCDYAILRILLNRQNIEIDKKNWFGVTALMVACEVNCREALQMMLKEGADPNKRTTNGYTALHYACTIRSMGLVFDLIGHGANINDCVSVFDVTPLSIAVIDQPSMPIAKFLLRKGAKLHEQKEFPLFLEATLACNSESKLTMFKLLIANGMDRHQLHPIEGRNCLHYVSISGYIPLAQYLITLNMESDLFVRDITGRTPMDLALDHLNFMVFHLLKLAYLKKRISPQSRTQLKLRKSMSRRMV